MEARKSDQACIWAAHSEPDLRAAIVGLEPGERLSLLINGAKTVWARMSNGKDGRPTLGIRIVDGKSAWQAIPLRGNFDLQTLRNEGDGLSATTAASGDTTATRLVVPPTTLSGSGPLFELYFFADYSGAADLKGQKKSIRSAHAEADGDCELVTERLTRDSLVLRTLEYLRMATDERQRACIGFDHQFGLPYGLLVEMGIAGMTWREALDAVVDGREFPPLQHASEYARKFNDWCIAQGRSHYFYSATKSGLYGIPDTDPRAADQDSVYRLTERCNSVLGSGSPKPFNRVGDNGTVGGQTIVGLAKLRELLAACSREGIPLRCWPFDGLDIAGPDYDGAHVLLEPYPSAARPLEIPQSDSADAIACVKLIQQYDREGKLARLLDLNALSEDHRDVVRVEGWIAGHNPLSLYGPRRSGA